MKKIVAMMMAVMMLGGILTGCGSSSNQEVSTSGDTAASSGAGTETKTIDISGVKLINDGKLTVGEEVGYPPFENFKEDGTTPEGFDVDIVTEVARRLGLEVEIINTAWDGIFSGIDVNYDCVCSAVTINAKRQKTMLFSTPYINNYQAVVIPADSDWKITSFKDLDGKSIAVQKETTSDELMSDYKSTGTIDTEIVANEKVTSCFTQLTNGEIDAVVVDSTVADGYIAKESDKYKIAFKDDSEAEQFGIAMGLKNTALQTAINEALADMEAEGFIDETYDYWFGSKAAIEE
ncbi:MAG: transporter substrate-binding domain-containing protein [Lachnospiraceae bacterium]|nr:transporter substrate-binding domain-containing protein [Lachnospiraceae bacterium]